MCRASSRSSASAPVLSLRSGPCETASRPAATPRTTLRPCPPETSAIPTWFANGGAGTTTAPRSATAKTPDGSIVACKAERNTRRLWWPPCQRTDGDFVTRGAGTKRALAVVGAPRQRSGRWRAAESSPSRAAVRLPRVQGARSGAARRDGVADGARQSTSSDDDPGGDAGRARRLRQDDAARPVGGARSPHVRLGHGGRA